MKIAIIGYGKMGHMIEEVALSRGHQITCVIDRFAVRPSQSDCKTANAVGPATPIRFYSPEEGFESEAFRSADVAIEFTTPTTAEDNIRKAWAQGVPVVCGSTGWRPEELRVEGLELREVDSRKLIVDSKTGKVMLVWSSNYSVGVNIFFDLNKFLAEKMKNLTLTLSQGEGEKGEGYTPSIKEIHHIHKLDKPSGTAKTLAEQISAMYEGRMYDVRREVPIESIREGEVPGTHEVTWDSEEDTIVITHIAKGRRGFALGAVLAAEEIKN
ncbi:MAG: 4-hydroxy-tetrahydrodipicolinate reductase [Paludibacteraceae bacterium]